MNSRGKIAISEIILLVVSIIAISWMVGSSLGVVSASGACEGKVDYLLTSDITCSTQGNKICGKNFANVDALYECRHDLNANWVLIERCDLGCENCACITDETKVDAGEVVETIVIGGAVEGGKQLVKKVPLPGKLKTSETTKKEIESTLATSTTTGTTVAEGESVGFLTNLYTKVLTKKGVEASKAAKIFGGSAASVTWAAITFVLVRKIALALGQSVEQSNALGGSAAAGVGSAVFASNVLGLGLGAATGVGFVIGGVVFLITYKKESQDIVAFSCYAWQPEYGGKNCEECNKQELECTEYQCKSLGKSCVLTSNEEGEKLCIWDNPHDIDPPIITPRDASLMNDYRYTPDNQISPPDKGVYVQYENSKDGCIPAFTPFTFGIELDEPGICKINTLRLDSYDEMGDIYFSNGVPKYNHTYVMSLPSKEYLDANNITLENGGDFELYVRCIDNNGYSNTANFVFKYCVDETPDTTAPEIVSTSIVSGSPIAAGTTDVRLSISVKDNSFLTDSASCKWSRLDKTYEDMENEFTCSHDLVSENVQLVYKCSTTLTGFTKINAENKFYFRCIDDGNYANTQSYEFSLVGTEELKIESASPNNTIIKNSTNKVVLDLEARTFGGADSGKAICAFSSTGEEGSYVDFWYGYDVEPFSQYKHIQAVELTEGDYGFYIRCRDEGGNIDTTWINFSVETDLEEPIIVRAFRSGDYLEILTDEPATCVYDTKNCLYEFKDGAPMQGDTDFASGIGHLIDWSLEDNFYIKCKDEYGNQPATGVCNIIARPFEIFEPI